MSQTADQNAVTNPRQSASNSSLRAIPVRACIRDCSRSALECNFLPDCSTHLSAAHLVLGDGSCDSQPNFNSKEPGHGQSISIYFVNSCPICRGTLRRAVCAAPSGPLP